MIKYSCEISLSLDSACQQLDRIGAKYKVTRETELSFRKRPTREAKRILSKYGFVREGEEPPKAATQGDLHRLEEHFR